MPIKNHCSTVFKNSMVVYGGQNEAGNCDAAMKVLQLDNYEWIKVQLKPE
jgi:hypothetical protein